ncbi:MAG: hypothetical protein V7L27_27155 [Nostoc sp.]
MGSSSSVSIFRYKIGIYRLIAIYGIFAGAVAIVVGIRIINLN